MTTFYFLTTEDMGDTITLSPRVPLGPAIGEERKTPRICVATSVEGCVRAVNQKKLKKQGNHLYVVDDPQGDDWCSPERHVEDAVENGEVWLTEPNTLRRVGTVDILSAPWDDELRIRVSKLT